MIWLRLVPNPLAQQAAPLQRSAACSAEAVHTALRGCWLVDCGFAVGNYWGGACMRCAGATAALGASSAKSHAKFFRDFMVLQTALLSVERFSGTPTTGLANAGRVPIGAERMYLIYRVLQKCRGLGDASRRDAVSWWNAAESIPGKAEVSFGQGACSGPFTRWRAMWLRGRMRQPASAGYRS